MGKPLVSVLIPVYNREKLVVRAIRSALKQTYENIEIIAVDNRSTDSTYEVLREYGSRYENVKVYQNEKNMGPVRNWRRCLEHSSGEFVKILFSDDWMDGAFVEKCTEILLHHEDVGFVYTATSIHLGDRTKMAYRCFAEGGVYDANIFIRKAVLIDPFGVSPDKSLLSVSPGNSLFRRKDVEDNLLIEIPTDLGLEFSKFGAGNDMLIYLLTAVRYPLFGYISEPLAHFDTPIDSITMCHDLSSYYLTATEYFVANFADKHLKKTFYTKMWLRSLKNKGIYSRLAKKKQIDILVVLKELSTYLGRKIL